MLCPSIYKKTLLYAIILWPRPLTYNVAPYFMLWDVGQGQFLSLIDSFSCKHIDLGGEKFPQEFDAHCRWQKHFHWISHRDWDHYSFLRQIKWKYQSVQIDFKKEKIYSGEKNRKKNDTSGVLQIGANLIPGDSLRRQEKIWARRLKKPAKLFVLGHHGSNTSNSRYLLDIIHPQLMQCLNSARKKKYGHPHKKVVARLKKAKCPLVGTQDWGHIAFRPL